MKLKICEVISNVEHININDVQKILDDKKAIKDYAYILHDKDNYTDKDEAKNAEHKAGTHKANHYHIVIRLNNAYDTKHIASWFGLAENFVGKPTGKGNGKTKEEIEAVKWCNMLKYLTHENAPQKHQYDESEVVSNYAWIDEKEKISSKSNSEARRIEIMNGIVDGTIREYNYFNYISIEEYDKYKRSIENAHQYRADKLKGGNREMNVIYITGKSGTGKSTFAKMLAEDKKFSYFVSSSSNDVLDGYKGEDCIILDDLRPSSMGLSDLLKMLDNNTASTVKSRYKNKVLECKLIIITSILPIDDFFKNVFQEQKEPIVQFKRRCSLYVQFEQKYYVVTCYNEDIKDYDFENSGVFENPVTALYSNKLNTKEQQQEFMKKMLLSDSKMIADNADAIIQAQFRNTKFTDKEQQMQNKIDMLQNHNNLLMNELDNRK